MDPRKRVRNNMDMHEMTPLEEARTRLQNLHDDLRLAYGTVPPYQYEDRMRELDNADAALHRASHAIDAAIARVWRIQTFPISRP